jgi:hypothetical protein
MTTKKPTLDDLGLDPDTLDWKRSGTAEGAIEVAFSEEWTFLRTADGPVSVFDEHEWTCFLDGVKKGEFDHAATPFRATPPEPPRETP